MSTIPEYHSSDPVYKAIDDRLRRFTPPIIIGRHIATMKDIGRTISEGITFKARNHHAFRLNLDFAKYGGISAFHWDNRKIWIHRLSASQTKGEGYREIGSPSLHCAVAKDECSVHIDEFGFVERGPNGETYYTPDSIRHIIDELVWRAKLRPVLQRGLDGALPNFLATPALKLLDQTYIVVPSAENRFGFSPFDNKFKPRVGVGLKLLDREKVKLRFEYTCGNLNCSDSRAMAILSLDLDKLGRR